MTRPLDVKAPRLIDLMARSKTGRFTIGSCCVSEKVCYFCTQRRKRPLPTGTQRRGDEIRDPEVLSDSWWGGGGLVKLQTTHRLILGGGGPDGANTYAAQG